MAGAYARLVVALRYPIVVAWIAAAVAATIYLPSLDQARSLPLRGLVPKHAEAVAAQLRSARLFGLALVPDAAIVQRSPRGLTPAAQRRVVERAALVDRGRERGSGVLFALPVLNTRGLFPSSRERGTTAVTYLFLAQTASLDERRAIASGYASTHVCRPGDALVGVTGSGPARLDEFDRIQGALPVVTAASIGLIALLLLATFRAVGAPLVTLAAAGIAYLVAARVVAWAGAQASISVPQEVEPLVIVLLLGVVTDYSIFFLAGARSRLAAGEDRIAATRGATASFVPIVLTAGLIVAAGTASLLAGTLDFFRAFGPGMALTALVAVVVCVTLVPALLAIFGRTIFWPGSRSRKGVPGAAPEEVALTLRGLRYRLAHLATSKPAAAALVALCTAVLLAAATGLRDLRLGFTLISGLPADAETRRAADAAGKGFAPGILSPTEVVVEAPGIVHRRASLARLEALLARERGVAGVVGPREQPTAFRGAALARTGSAARYALIFEDDSIGAAAIHDLAVVQAAMPALLTRSGLGAARVSYAGETALAQETVDSTVGDLRRIALVALAVNLVLLAVFLRALVAPVLLLVASILALAATLGLTTIVFQNVLGYGELTYYVPFAAAVLLVALGSDYNVFVAGQMWDEARRRPLREAIALAAPRASKAITVAGMALAFSFAFLAIVPLRAFREFAFAMCLGVLLDALVVRSLLVPALVSLFGEASWWPGRRRRAPSVATRRAEITRTVGMSGSRAGAGAERARSPDVGRS